MAEALSTSKDKAVEAHARDELGIDLEDLDQKTNPWQARLKRPPLIGAIGVFAQAVLFWPLQAARCSASATKAAKSGMGISLKNDQYCICAGCLMRLSCAFLMTIGTCRGVCAEYVLRSDMLHMEEGSLVTLTCVVGPTGSWCLSTFFLDWRCHSSFGRRFHH